MNFNAFTDPVKKLLFNKNPIKPAPYQRKFKRINKNKTFWGSLKYRRRLVYNSQSGQAVNPERRAERAKMRDLGFDNMKSFRRFQKKERRMIKNG